MQPPRGVLLYGPSGTGKTALAHALALKIAPFANFIPVQATEIMSSGMGDSERAIASLFALARQCAPTVLFIDSIEALTPPRGSDEASGNSTMDRVLSQFLIEMDGVKTDALRPVMLLGASSSPDRIDPALLRPGRLEHHILVPPPDETARLQVLQARVNATPHAYTPEGAEALVGLAQDTDGFSMADLDLLVRGASLAALRDTISLRRADATKGVTGTGTDARGDVRVSEAHVRQARARGVASLLGVEIRKP
ncbi:P-loop containing nucleoside triphosphate hydrolase protein, partial [Baffinella frigidus]